ncbi:hypothetical protein DPMN_056167 [Dreissena polymorpha]|uniref:Core-binding (CB) domain-containing protein n=1 Tax=Dreissena polymorpha TaxID=45954 RepID=A0A9D4CSQ2_DREPO|nr:hypothetical protein DPMN_056167 [Dreissena polymorpha]
MRFRSIGTDWTPTPTPTHSDSSNIGENRSEFVSHNPDCPLLAQESLVQRSSQSPMRLSLETSSQIRSSVSKRQTTCGSTNVPLTRLAVIRQSLQKKRFSVRASTLVDSARRKSTRAVYDARWKIFSNWCIRGKIDPLNPSSRRIADFLIYLFDDKKLSLSYIKGYRLMISHTLAFSKSSQVCADPAISELIRAMELNVLFLGQLLLNGIWLVFLILLLRLHISLWIKLLYSF